MCSGQQHCTVLCCKIYAQEEDDIHIARAMYDSGNKLLDTRPVSITDSSGGTNMPRMFVRLLAQCEASIAKRATKQLQLNAAKVCDTADLIRLLIVMCLA